MLPVKYEYVQIKCSGVKSEKYISRSHRKWEHSSKVHVAKTLEFLSECLVALHHCH